MRKLFVAFFLVFIASGTDVSANCAPDLRNILKSTRNLKDLEMKRDLVFVSYPILSPDYSAYLESDGHKAYLKGDISSRILKMPSEAREEIRKKFRDKLRNLNPSFIFSGRSASPDSDDRIILKKRAEWDNLIRQRKFDDPRLQILLNDFKNLVGFIDIIFLIRNLSKDLVEIPKYEQTLKRQILEVIQKHTEVILVFLASVANCDHIEKNLDVNNINQICQRITQHLRISKYLPQFILKRLNPISNNLTRALSSLEVSTIFGMLLPDSLEVLSNLSEYETEVLKLNLKKNPNTFDIKKIDREDSYENWILIYGEAHKIINRIQKTKE